MRKNVALVLVGLGIGCGIGAVATRQAIAQGYPTAPPYAPPAAPARWQQFCEQAASVQEASTIAGARGAEGFELVALHNGVLCFKRPLMTGSAPPAPRPTAPAGFPGY